MSVLLLQLRLLGAPRSTISLALILVASYSAASMRLFTFDMTRAPGVIECYPLLLWASVAWGVTVWNDAGPAKRDYFWAMPIGRGRHALLRALAGAAWLLAGIAVLAALANVADIVRYGAVPAASTLAWVSLFTGPLTLFLLTSAAAVVSAYPGRWAIGTLIVWTVLHRTCDGNPRCGPLVGGRSVAAELLGLTSALMETMRSEFVASAPHPPFLFTLIVGWIVVALVAVVLAARRLPNI